MSAGETVSSVPLHGEFDLRLDDNGRLTLPRAVRAQMAERGSIALIARGDTSVRQSALWLVPERPYDDMSAEHDGAEDAPGFDLRTLDDAATTRLECDKRGRVALPTGLLWQFGIVAPEVTLIGVGDHYELWGQSSWEKHRATLRTRPVTPS